MIDLAKERLFTLKQTDVSEFEKTNYYLLNDEEIMFYFKGKRDEIIITSHRILAVDKQGVTGSKIDISTFPLKNILAFSIENAGTFDRDCELVIVLSGLGKMTLRIDKNADSAKINQYLTNKLLVD